VEERVFYSEDNAIQGCSIGERVSNETGEREESRAKGGGVSLELKASKMGLSSYGRYNALVGGGFLVLADKREYQAETSSTPEMRAGEGGKLTNLLKSRKGEVWRKHLTRELRA